MSIIQFIRKILKPTTSAFNASDYDTSAQTTYTWASKALGTAAANRQIVAAFSCQNATRTGSSATIGGVSATFLFRVTNSTSTVEFWIASVPTGTSGTYSITWSGANDQGGFAAWSLYGGASTAHDTASSTADPLSASLSIPAGGSAFGYAIGFANNPTFTWSGGLSEDADEIWTPTDIGHSGASADFASGSSPTIEAAQSTTTTRPTLALISFAPG